MKTSTKKWIFAALFAALTTVATMVIKLPTPTMGYIHPGDTIVVLSGLLLGPLYGGLAAGIGSMLADLFSGYLFYAPATFVIKAITAIVAYFVFQAIIKVFHAEKKGGQFAIALIAGAIGEICMVLGYFVFEIFLLALETGNGLTASSLTSGIAAAASGIPYNIVQGLFGAIAGAILYPLIKKPFLKLGE